MFLGGTRFEMKKLRKSIKMPLELSINIVANGLPSQITIKVNS